jgi:hypothetical protein
MVMDRNFQYPHCERVNVISSECIIIVEDRLVLVSDEMICESEGHEWL